MFIEAQRRSSCNALKQGAATKIDIKRSSKKLEIMSWNTMGLTFNYVRIKMVQNSFIELVLRVSLKASLKAPPHGLFQPLGILSSSL